MQAPITIMPDMVNNSVEFSHAISGLYWINQDHHKIAEKLTLQLYDYLLVNFKIFQRDFTQTNLKKLAQKTNKKEEDISQIIQYIEQINNSDQITKTALMDFYKKAFAFMK
jgi:replicative superfamily II helicase